MTTSEEFDFVIVGAGMAGASTAFFLADRGRVLVLEMEDQPGYHTTGRSAAVYSEAYGNASIRGLTTGGRPFFTAPPEGFTDHPILGPRGLIFIGRADQRESLEKAAAEASQLVDNVREITTAEALERLPVLNPDYVAGGVIEPDAMDIDVNALHQGFMRGARAKGAEFVNNAEVTALTRNGAGWEVTSRECTVRAGVVVSASGAWADRVADMAGAKRVELVPKRRTAILFDAPDGMDTSDWSLCVDADEEFYIKPESGAVMGSPADETPMEPCDVQPDELDVAIAVDRIQNATTLDIRRITRSWAGLRSFVADKTPVVGFDPGVEKFFWLAGQGGYGIQTAPSLGRVSAALACGEGIPADLEDLGVTAAALSPGRFGK